MASGVGEGLQIPWLAIEFEVKLGRRPFICVRAHIHEFEEEFKRKLGRGEVSLAEHGVGHHFIASLPLRLCYYFLQQCTVTSSYRCLTTAVTAA